MKARAATNLAFLYSLEGDASSAQRYADLAVATDKYSAQALVNKVCPSVLLTVLLHEGTPVCVINALPGCHPVGDTTYAVTELLPSCTAVFDYRWREALA